jgi:long-chain acyl-CoA synthetase
MAITFEEAVSRVTGPGQPFEITEVERDGVTYRAFRHVPPTLREVFAGARARPDQVFMVYQDEQWTFGEVMRQVDALGAALVEDFGVTKGDRVAIALRNLPEWVVAFAAALSVGAVAVSLNAWWTEDELAFGLEDCGASVLVADPERVERSAAACRRLGVRVIGVRMPEADGGPAGVGAGAVAGAAAGGTPGVTRWADVVAQTRSLPPVPLGPDDDATILYTSGTTGRPKGAVSTHGAVVQALGGFGCAVTVQRLRLSGAEGAAPEGTAPEGAASPPVFILVVPLFHVTGCVPVMLSCFALGMKLVMLRKWDPEEALRLIERERVTNFVGVPTQSWDLLECPRFADFDTSSLVSVGGGGAPAPPTLVRRVEDGFRAGRPQIGYGMTETKADRALPVGERGEIYLKGPNLIRGYWGRPDATAESLAAGWLRTGDVGRLDDEGFLYIEDRAKDMVLRAGENVYCAEVEAAIYEHPAVYEVAVLGVPHERLGEEVAAVVCLRDGEQLSTEALQSHVGERLAAFKVPAHVYFVAERLPRSASGKILKRELRDGLLA